MEGPGAEDDAWCDILTLQGAGGQGRAAAPQTRRQVNPSPYKHLNLTPQADHTRLGAPLLQVYRAPFYHLFLHKLLLKVCSSSLPLQGGDLGAGLHPGAGGGAGGGAQEVDRPPQTP